MIFKFLEFLQPHWYNIVYMFLEFLQTPLI